MRGVRFHLLNEYNQYLWEIFKFLDILKYTWYISQTEILYYNKKEGKVCSDFFPSDKLTGAEFKECIARNEYYVYLANIQAYPLNTEREEILTYDEFERSRCETILLCADSIYVDLYSKNKAFLKNVYDMGIQIGFKNVEYITNSNDERTGLRL
jgi:hypothetical protein